ncbi:MAG: FliH/SctL family protein [Acetivibrionales bacterium]
MYSKIYKNKYVTYGEPFQVRIRRQLENFNEDTASGDIDDLTDSANPEKMIEKARQKAEELIQEAEQEAVKIIDRARKEAEDKAGEITEEAWQRGYAEGMDAAARQSKEFLAEAEKIRNNAAEEYKRAMAGMEEEVIGLVMEVSRKAVAAELTVNKDVIIQLVRDALQNCSNKNGAILKMSPADYEYIMKNEERFNSVIEGADSLNIKPDAALKPGDCIVETALGDMDAGVSTRLDKIEEAFKEELEGR